MKKYICEDCIKDMNLKAGKGFVWYAMQKCYLCQEEKLKVAEVGHLLKAEQQEGSN